MRIVILNICYIVIGIREIFFDKKLFGMQSTIVWLHSSFPFFLARDYLGAKIILAYSATADIFILITRKFCSVVIEGRINWNSNFDHI